LKVADDTLSGRVRTLAATLKGSPKQYERNLSARLLEVADEPPAGRRAKVRSTVSLADWNWFQTKVNISQSMAETLKNHPDRRAREIAGEFAKDLAEAKKAQEVLQALLES
jgi:hypothetical protein